MSVSAETVFIDGATVLQAITTTVRGSRLACSVQASPRVDVDVTLEFPSPFELETVHDHVQGTHSSVSLSRGGHGPVPGLCQIVVWPNVGRVWVLCGSDGGCSGKEVSLGHASMWRVLAVKYCRVGPLLEKVIWSETLSFMSGRLEGGASRQKAPQLPGSWICLSCKMRGC